MKETLSYDIETVNEILSYNIETVIDIKDRIILQSLINDKKEVISRWVLDTREQSTKEALIKLGWTSPDE